MGHPFDNQKMTDKTMKNLIIATVIACLSSTAALAHATLETSESAQGAAYKAVLRVGHGCEGESTLKVRVQIPEGVISVKPMPKPGWTLETVKGPYAEAYDYFGTKLTEGVKEIVWTGELPDEFYDEFVFRGTIAATMPVGSTVYFPAVQECATKSERWIELPAEGQDPHDLESPAPGVKITAPVEGH